MWSWALLLIIAIITIGFYSRFKKPMGAILFGAGSGAVAFGLVGYFTSGLLTLTWFNVLLSLFAGIPGVLTAVLLGRFF